MLCSLSNLSGTDLAKVQELESELGQTILAYSCHQAEPAQLDSDKLAKIQEVEKSLGLSLVAVAG